MVDLKINLLLQAYHDMGYDALALGPGDLSLGLSYLRRLKDKARFPFLLGNLVEKETSQRIFNRYLLKDFNGFKVGVFGLLSTNGLLYARPEDKEKFRLLPPIETARSILLELKAMKCQTIVAITHMSPEENQSLAEACPEIQWIIQGDSKEAKAEAKVLHKTQILNAGDRGEFLGRIDLKETGKTQKALFRLQPLGEDLLEDPALLDRLSQYKEAVAKLAGTPGGSTGAAPRAPDQPLAFRISPYLGEASCLPCHEPQHQAWQKSPHAKAYHTLMALNKASDPNCLPCHTTGFEVLNQPGEILENVQCEACHGPRRGHPEPQKKFAPVSESQCLRCHNETKSPNYHYRTYLLKVTCPK